MAALKNPAEPPVPIQMTALRWRAVIVLFGFMGWSAFTTGWAYSPWAGGSNLDLPPGLDLLGNFVGIGFWSSMWLITGALMVIAAITGLRRPWFDIAIRLQVFMLCIWALSYVYGFLQWKWGIPPGPGQPRGYLASSTYMRSVESNLALLLLIEWVREKVPPQHPPWRRQVADWWRNRGSR